MSPRRLTTEPRSSLTGAFLFVDCGPALRFQIAQHGPHHLIKRKEPFDDPAYLLELKLDGFRGLANTIAGRMLSKNGNRLRRFSGDHIANGQRGLIGLKSM